jgi:hypothetical protein
MIITMKVPDLDRLAEEIGDAVTALEEVREEGDEERAAEALDDLRNACEELSNTALDILTEAENE